MLFAASDELTATLIIVVGIAGGAIAWVAARRDKVDAGSIARLEGYIERLQKDNAACTARSDAQDKRIDAQDTEILKLNKKYLYAVSWILRYSDVMKDKGIPHDEFQEPPSA